MMLKSRLMRHMFAKLLSALCNNSKAQVRLSACFAMKKPSKAKPMACAKKDGTKVSENVTTTFSVSFIFGFALHTINFTIGTFVEPCVRLVSLEAPRKLDEPRYSNLFMIGFITDFVFRFGFMAFSIA